VLHVDGEIEALGMLTDRREALTRRRVQTVDRLQALLAELLPGQAKRDITTGQAKAMLASVRPSDIAGKTRRRIAAEELTELIAVEAKIKKATAGLNVMVLARGSHVMDIHGAGPVVAARILADVVDVARFSDRNRFNLRDARTCRSQGPGILAGVNRSTGASDACAKSPTSRILQVGHRQVRFHRAPRASEC